MTHSCVRLSNKVNVCAGLVEVVSEKKTSTSGALFGGVLDTHTHTHTRHPILIEPRSRLM